jgi:CubicO group peptidase (beta-lactamase class C family)
MKNYFISLITLLTVCLIYEKSVAQSDIIIQKGLGEKIDSMLKMEELNGFSGSVLVIKKDTIILQNGYGTTDSTKTVGINPSTRFYLASTTKGVTGVVTLIAQEKRLLSVNDTIRKFFPNAPFEYSSIRIHDMLIHYSGLSSEYETFGYSSLNANISLIFNKELSNEKRFIYTGAGYWLTAAIIEKVSKLPYEDFVRKEVFEKAKMNNSAFWFEIDDNNKNSVAQKLSEFPPNEIKPNWGFRASSGILTNIIDVGNFFKALSNGEIISEDGLEQLFGPHITLNSGIGIGYGWYTTLTNRGTQEIWSRGGEEFGHNSAIRWFRDEGVLIAILTNCGQMEGEDREANRTISDKIENILFSN